MGQRARGRFKCDCNRCTMVIRNKMNDRFEAKLVAEAIEPDEDVIYDHWHDWEKEYDL